MSALDFTPPDDALTALRERKRLFDDVWLLTLFVIFVAIAAPWFLRILDLDLEPLAWSLFGFGLVYMAGVMATDRMQNRRNLLLVIAILQMLGVLFLGYVWHLAGGLQNPMFLLVFVLPVVAGSLVLVSWQSYTTVLMAVVAVALVALIEAPELRWYLVQIGIPAESLIKHLPESSTGAPQLLSSLNAPASYFFVVLELFAIFLLALALMTGSLNALLRRLYDRLGSSVKALNEAEIWSQEILRASPVPAVLVYADTFTVAQASQSFMHHLMLTADSSLDKHLFGLINFSYPDVVEALIVGEGGEIPLAAYRVGAVTRLARIRVRPIHHRGTRYAYVSVEDISQLYYLQAAFDAAADAQIAVSADGRILHFNPAALALFGNLHFGMAATPALDQPHLPGDWWELGLRKRLVREVELGNRPFQVHAVAVEIPGERERFTLLTMHSRQGTQ